MEENEELEVAAAEITAREEIKARMLARLESSLKKADDGSFIYEGTNLDDFYDYLVFMDAAEIGDRDIRFKVDGKVYTKEEIDSDFANIQAHIMEIEKGATPNRTRMELDLLEAKTRKKDAVKTLEELEEEFASLERRCQEEGKVLPSDSIEHSEEEAEK